MLIYVACAAELSNFVSFMRRMYFALFYECNSVAARSGSSSRLAPCLLSCTSFLCTAFVHLIMVGLQITLLFCFYKIPCTLITSPTSYLQRVLCLPFFSRGGQRGLLAAYAGRMLGSWRPWWTRKHAYSHYSLLL